MEPKQEYKYIGECKGNNDNGCFMESPGHDCGCFKRIQQEEPKQDYSGVHLRHCYQGEYEDGCKYGEDDCPAKPLEPKQETLEELAKRKYLTRLDNFQKVDFKDGVFEGAKWQAERMYSEGDMKWAYFSAIEETGEGWNGEYANGNNPNIEDKFSEGFNKWFEQYRKK